MLIRNSERIPCSLLQVKHVAALLYRRDRFESSVQSILLYRHPSIMNIHKPDAAKPVPAASVILVRQHQAELQVYLLKRNVQSGFMAGNYVFAGGVLDSEDREFAVWKDYVDLDTEGLNRRLGGGLGEEDILAYGVAAIRETLEEAGVFMAVEAMRRSADLKRIEHLRMDGDLRKNWFLKRVVSDGWILKLSALSRWSHWITPVAMKRRFDTRFFLAELPSGQRCRPDGRETIHGLWISPPKALAGNFSGQIPLSPPTLVMLQEFLKYPTLDELKKEGHCRMWRIPNLPRMIALDKGGVLIEPWDEAYAEPDIKIDARSLQRALLPAGEPFSRIWHNGGFWRPIRA